MKLFSDILFTTDLFVFSQKNSSGILLECLSENNFSFRNGKSIIQCMPYNIEYYEIQYGADMTKILTQLLFFIQKFL